MEEKEKILLKGNSTHLTFRINKDLLKLVDKISKKCEITRTDFIKHAIIHTYIEVRLKNEK